MKRPAVPTSHSVHVLDRRETLTDLVARANHLLAESLRAQLKAGGLSAIEGRVLAALAERDGVPLGDLAQKLLAKQPTLAKVVHRMERGQLVECGMASEDRSVALIGLTTRGRQLAAVLVECTRDWETRVAEVLGKENLRQCTALLAAVVDRLDQSRWHRKKPAG